MWVFYFMLDSIIVPVYHCIIIKHKEGNMKRIPVMLDEKQHEILRKLAFDTKLSISEHIRRAVDEYLARKEKGSKNG